MSEEGREGRPGTLQPQESGQPEQCRGALWALACLTSWQSPRAEQTAKGGSSSFKRFCLNSCRLHTFPHLPSRERDFNNELLHDNRPLINSLLFFWGQISLIKVGWGGGGEPGLSDLLHLTWTLAARPGIAAQRPFLVTSFSRAGHLLLLGVRPLLC